MLVSRLRKVLLTVTTQRTEFFAETFSNISLHYGYADLCLAVWFSAQKICDRRDGGDRFLCRHDPFLFSLPVPLFAAQNIAILMHSVEGS